ncbi:MULTISPECIES: ABC transporter substrate-binding protein [Jonquetella]|uniref:ABC-type dipeptide transport system, periplasmic component n=1 Tax=Jonquetella anthropi DSM 22815 TaxID=885272 RepID=H0UKZ7_9BACT|nr:MULTISPECIES: ABC transporter substrate-binding protein [Jonquetella]EHM13356.1 ABC-type dipeptide transport system, periplasmic component [Jonquetella anthropi DSM 22815]ERL24884.1 ABC transporter, substrate-binding protein, family 5 [Jonquetella sp. BV3C21]
MKKSFLVLALTAALCACALPAAADPKDTLVVGVNVDAKNLDPQNSVDTASFSLIKQVFEPLVTVDGKTRELVPVLAEKWERLDDITYKFYLRKGVKFHNGEELTADDVVFSLKRATDPTQSVYAGSSGKFINPNGFEIIDKYTVIVRTNGPVGSFLAHMKHPYASIFCRKAVEEAGSDVSRRPIGTGPFKFVSWNKGEKLTLTRFDDYWGKKANFKNLEFLILPDESSRVIALETGKADFIYAVPSSDAERIDQSDKVHVIKGPSMVLMHLGLNTQSPKLSDPRVRQAIDYALDKRVLNQVVYQGNSEVPAGPLLPAHMWYPKDAQPWPFDQQKAKELLAESGVKLPLELNLWVINAQERIDLATVIQSMLAQVGINVNVQVFENAVFEEKIKSGQHDMYIITWGAQTTRDPSFYWQTMLYSKAAGTTNKSFTKNPEIDKFIDESISTLEQEKRFEVFAKLWDVIQAYHPIVALALPNELYGARRDLKGTEDLCDGKINYLGNLHY